VQSPNLIFLKKAPFIRLVIPLIAGIVAEWYAAPGLYCWGIIAPSCLLLLFFFSFSSIFNRFRLSAINGIAISDLIVSMGGLLTHQKDPRNSKFWFGRNNNANPAYVVIIDEPLQEKPKSWKAVAVVKEIIDETGAKHASGKMIIYFRKDSLPKPGFGSLIFFRKKIDEIRNSGNPGCFDYRSYGIFHGFTHQVFLNNHEYVTVSSKQNGFRSFIYSWRQKIIGILNENIKIKKELGLAEALLIGYKDDIDKTLVQSYSNTGVVHIIAISGLHLGLIYMLLGLLTKPFQKLKKLYWLRFLIIISGLWLFSFMAGAQPSILRSAIMFTCIAAGELIYKKTSVYNSIACSAFILLCINPFWLWDLGFQLSYTALISILVFMRPIYNLFYIKNRFLDLIWKLNAVTLAAQVLTIPLTLFYFHQFPNFFLVTNFIAVPLSSLILLSEIFLCLISFSAFMAEFCGKVICFLLRFMNSFIERIDRLQFSVWESLSLNFYQVILLYAVILFITFWLHYKTARNFIIALFAILVFLCFRSLSFIRANNQEAIIVYNVPGKPAMDIIRKRHFTFIGDSSLDKDPGSQQFFLKPSRILFRTSLTPSPVKIRSKIFEANGMNFLVIDKALVFDPGPEKIPVDLLLVSGKPEIDFENIFATFDIRQIVIDSYVPLWKAGSLKSILDSLGKEYYDVSERGAFVISQR
jgi:competence protein ComEC